MARDHARLMTRIWADPEFLAMTEAQQRAYLLVLSTPGMTHCGVAPLTVKRWAKQAADSSTQKLTRLLETLGERRYLIPDWETEEILVRSLLRNDRVFRLPNVAKNAYSSWREVQSPVIRAHMLFEVHRIAEGPAADRNVKSFDDDCAGPWLKEPLPEGLPKGFTEGFQEPFPEGFTELLGER